MRVLVKGRLKQLTAVKGQSRSLITIFISHLIFVLQSFNITSLRISPVEYCYKFANQGTILQQ